MRIDIRTDATIFGTRSYDLLCGEDRAGSLSWDGRGSFEAELLGRRVRIHQLDALERARLLGKGMRPLAVEGDLSGSLSTLREKDGLVGSCVSYVLDAGGSAVCGYPNPGGGRGWRMSVYLDGEQIALAKRASDPVHTPDGFQIVAPDGDAALRALVLVIYDVYASYLENDGGVAGPLGFREVRLFGKRARELDDPLFEARCEGELEDGAADSGEDAAQPESAADRAARIAQGFAVKGDIGHRG
jgi:hypothetical protein